MRRSSPSVHELVAHIVNAIERAESHDAPFHHLILDRVFPPAVYDAILDAMPPPSYCWPLGGRHRQSNRRADGSATRVKVDLVPEITRRFDRDRRALWTMVGNALLAPEVRDAF